MCYLFHKKNQVGDVSAILRLNGAGCRYLVNDAAFILYLERCRSIECCKQCVLLHLTENLFLCSRSAEEMVRVGVTVGRRVRLPV
jgi:hypothetical protein